jgi:invasion protein IalB
MKILQAHALRLAAVALLMLSIAPARAQQAAPAKGAAPAPSPAAQPAPSAWAVTCTDQLKPQFSCEMTQNILDQQSGGQVVLLSVKPSSDGGAPAMIVRALHGVYLPAGLSLKVDNGAATALPFQKSDRLGVYAALPLTSQIVGDMKKGAEIHLSMQLNKDQPFVIIARLNGFGPAYDKISQLK